MLGLVVEIKGDAKGLGSELDAAGGKVKGLGGVLSGGIGQLAVFGGIAAGAGVALIGMADAAAQDEAEQNRLLTAITAAGAATATSTDQVNAAIAAGQELAFTDSETRDALQSLVTATGDVSTATADLAVAQDIARFAGVDLATAADAVAKATAGQDGALRKLMPGLEKGATATDTLGAAQQLAAGQAKVYGDSAAGAGAKTSDAFGELAETVGSALLPILTDLLPAIIPIIKALGTLISAVLPVITPLIKILAQALGVVAGAIAEVVRQLAKLIDWFVKAIGKVGEFLDSINPLKGVGNLLDSINPFAGPAAAGLSAGGLARGARAGGGGGSSGITVNVYGDPGQVEAAVMRALRTYNRRNATGR